MRVIAGTKKGLLLKAPSGDNIRPTSAKVKEALFSMLDPYINGAFFLDLFAGTGSIGIEALSRGASRAVFIDDNINALACINKNVLKCGFTRESKIQRSDAFRFLGKTRDIYDIIYLDPPYNDDISAHIKVISERKLLSADGVCAVECAAFSPPNIEFDILKNKLYNATRVIIFPITLKEDLDGYNP